jgi:DNA-binding transcriptional LysR family regulator
VDIIPAYMPPILRRFHAAWPRVRVSIVASNSHDLLDDLAHGKVDITLSTDREKGRNAETLRVDRLKWVGARRGDAHLRTPLPVSIGSTSCRFRPVVLDALRQAGIDWRVVLAVSNQDAINSTVSAGIAVAAMLTDSIPANLEPIDASAGLPPLPDFQINLSLPAAGGSDVAKELARHIRAEFHQRFAMPGTAPGASGVKATDVGAGVQTADRPRTLRTPVAAK